MRLLNNDVKLVIQVVDEIETSHEDVWDLNTRGVCTGEIVRSRIRSCLPKDLAYRILASLGLTRKKVGAKGAKVKKLFEKRAPPPIDVGVYVYRYADPSLPKPLYLILYVHELMCTEMYHDIYATGSREKAREFAKRLAEKLR